MDHCGSHGTLLRFSPQSSRLSICYYHHDLHWRALQPGLRLAFAAARHAPLQIARGVGTVPRHGTPPAGIARYEPRRGVA